jgi:4-hydroxy-tetrahydrodipicolinate synthase
MPITGVLPVIPTPFRDGRVDASSLRSMIERMLPSVDGYTLAGSTGESPSMTLDERLALIELALGFTPSDKTVIVGINHTCQADSIRLAQQAQSLGARGVLCPAPYYYPLSSDGALRYLEGIDRALEIDLVLYDNPVTTKLALGAPTVIEWAAQLEHLSSVKLTDHDLSKVAAWQAAGLSVLAGDDGILFRYLAEGVDGVMVIAPIVFPEAFAACWRQVRAGDLAGAQQVFANEVEPFLHVFGVGDEIATTKAILAHLGVISSDELRPPLLDSSPRRRALLRRAFDLCAARSRERLAADPGLLDGVTSRP